MDILSYSYALGTRSDKYAQKGLHIDDRYKVSTLNHGCCKPNMGSCPVNLVTGGYRILAQTQPYPFGLANVTDLPATLINCWWIPHVLQNERISCKVLAPPSLVDASISTHFRHRQSTKYRLRRPGLLRILLILSLMLETLI